MKGWQIFACVVSMGMVSCTSMTPAQCMVADWRALGEQDAFSGRGEQLARHFKSCQPTGVIPDKVQYRAGYQAGLTAYCQPLHILQQAAEGQGSIKKCPVAQQARLNTYYLAGKHLHQAETRLAQLEREQRKLEKELVDSQKTDQERHEARQKLRDLDADMSRERREKQYAESRWLELKTSL